MAKKTTYKPTYVSAVAPVDTVGTYTPGTYTSQYASQIAAAQDNILNWKYDPLQDASYQALAKVYAAKGEQAAKNSLGDAAALNGGYGTSYAVSAAQQARNQYNQELASYIPDLESNAYSKAQTRLSTLRDADNTDYTRFRDTESDRQTAYNLNYQKYRDALSDYQWAMDYNNTVYSLKKSSSSGGGGSSGGKSGTGFIGSALTGLYSDAEDDAKGGNKKTTKKTTLSKPAGNSGNWKGKSTTVSKPQTAVQKSIAKQIDAKVASNKKKK